MKRPIVCVLVPWLALMATLAAWAQGIPSKTKEPPTESTSLKAKDSAASPAERYRDVLKAYQKARGEFLTAYRAAKTDAERRKVIETKQPDSDSYADKMLKIAQDAPRDPVAVEALIWVSLNSWGPKSQKAMKILVEPENNSPFVQYMSRRL